MSTAAAETPAITVTEIPGKGRSLISTKPIKAGEIILTDSPILLYSALPFSPPNHHHQIYCSNCFKSIQNPPTFSCPNCPSTFFCNPICSKTSSHSPYLCQSLLRLQDYLTHHYIDNHDLHIQAKFLISAFNLSFTSPNSFAALLNLQGEVESADSAHFLHSLVFTLSPPPPNKDFGFSVEMTGALLAKDKINAFGLMDVFGEDKDRAVRAYGIYPKASFFNHDCLPNACRFEYLDCDSRNCTSTDMVIRAIHDVDEGREICLSYFPVNLKYVDRQKRLREDYGFVCECDRCKVEANWFDDGEEEDGEAMEEGEEGFGDGNVMVDDDEEVVGGESVDQNGGDFPHAYFFIKYMCNRKNCWGTLAPLPPLDPRAGLMECNVCGNLTKEE